LTKQTLTVTKIRMDHMCPNCEEDSETSLHFFR